MLSLNGLASAALFLVGRLSLIFGVTRIVNFAHGSFCVLGIITSPTALANTIGGARHFWGTFLLAAGVAVAVIGLAVELLLLRRIYDAPEICCTSRHLRAGAGDQGRHAGSLGCEDLLGPRAPGFRGAIDIFGKPFPTYDLLLIVIWRGHVAGLDRLAAAHRFGLLLRAATQDREMTDALG